VKSKLLYLSICLVLFACNKEESSYTSKAHSEKTKQTSIETAVRNESNPKPEVLNTSNDNNLKTEVKNTSLTKIKTENNLLIANGPIPYDLEEFYGKGPRYIPEFAEMVFNYKDSTDDKALIDVMIKHDIIYDIYTGVFDQKIEDSNPRLDDFRKIKITGSDDWYYFMDVDFDNAMYMPNSSLPFRAQIVLNESGEIVYFAEAEHIDFIHLNDSDAFTLLVHFVTPGYSGTYFLMQMYEGKMAFVSPHNKPNHELELYLSVAQSRSITPWPNDRHLRVTDVNQDGYEDIRIRCIHHSEYIDLEGILDFDTVDLDDDKYKEYIKRNYYHFEEISYLYDPRLKSYYLSQEEIPHYDSLYPFINPDRS
jgi:hypothetical protein